MKIRHITIRHTPEMLLQMIADKGVAMAVLEAAPKLAMLVRLGGVPVGRRLAAKDVAIEVRGAGDVYQPRLDLELPLGARLADLTLHATATMDLGLLASVVVETEPPGRRKGQWSGAVTETLELPVVCAVEPEVGRVE